MIISMFTFEQWYYGGWFSNSIKNPHNMIRSENPNKQLLNYNRMALFKSIFNLEFKVIVRLSM